MYLLLQAVHLSCILVLQQLQLMGMLQLQACQCLAVALCQDLLGIAVTLNDVTGWLNKSRYVLAHQAASCLEQLVNYKSASFSQATASLLWTFCITNKAGVVLLFE